MEGEDDCILYAELTHGESGFVDTGGLGTCAQDIGFNGNVIGIRYPHHLIEEADIVSRWASTYCRCETTYYGAESIR